MSSESPVVSSTSGVEAPAGLGRVIATIVGYVVNPLIFPPIVYGLALSHVGAPPDDVAAGVAIGAVFLGLVPLVHVGWMWMKGEVGSLEIRNRSKRTEPFLVALGATVLALLVVGGINLEGEQLLAAMLGCHLVNTLLLLGITQRWKISVHCASVAGAVGTLAFVHFHVPGGVLGTAGLGRIVLVGGLVLIPLLVWARVRSRAHTILQAATGTALGFAAPYLELYGWFAGLGL